MVTVALIEKLKTLMPDVTVSEWLNPQKKVFALIYSKSTRTTIEYNLIWTGKGKSANFTDRFLTETNYVYTNLPIKLQVSNRGDFQTLVVDDKNYSWYVDISNEEDESVSILPNEKEIEITKTFKIIVNKGG